jgi:VanZ family protein
MSSLRALALGYLPLILGCAAIFVASSMPGPPIPTPLAFPHSDKLLHACAYAVLGTLALFGAARRIGAAERRASIEAALVAAIYGASDELHQAFVPGRTSELLDLAADSSGGLLGAFVLGPMLWRAWARRRERQPS